MKNVRTTFECRKLAVAMLVMFCLHTLFVSAGQAEDAKAVLKVHRKASFNCAADRMDVYVNDEKLGSVSNGATKEFEFVPCKDGKNKLFMEIVVPLGPNAKSPVLEMVARAGGTVNAVTTIRTGLVKGSLTVEMTTVQPGKGSLVLGKVTIKENKVEKEGRVDFVESEVGGETTYSKSRTIRREVIYAMKFGLSAEAEAKLRAGILLARADMTAKIKASIEGERGEKWTDEITETATHKINLDKNPKVKVIWLDVYRTGSIEVKLDGKMQVVPFEFPIATRTVIKAVR